MFDKNNKIVINQVYLIKNACGATKDGLHHTFKFTSQHARKNPFRIKGLEHVKSVRK